MSQNQSTYPSKITETSKNICHFSASCRKKFYNIVHSFILKKFISPLSHLIIWIRDVVLSVPFCYLLLVTQQKTVQGLTAVHSATRRSCWLKVSFRRHLSCLWHSVCSRLQIQPPSWAVNRQEASSNAVEACLVSVTRCTQKYMIDAAVTMSFHFNSHLSWNILNTTNDPRHKTAIIRVGALSKTFATFNWVHVLKEAGIKVKGQDRHFRWMKAGGEALQTSWRSILKSETVGSNFVWLYRFETKSKWEKKCYLPVSLYTSCIISTKQKVQCV